MATLHREVERKYALEHADPLLDLTAALTAVPGVAAVDGPTATTLEALYLDTADLALARARTTLRRRTGGHDAGWHLKLPTDGGGTGARHEVQLPLGPPPAAGSGGGDAAPVVPEELQSLAWSVTRGAPLVPVARLVTERAVRHLRDDTGRVLAEVADDRVTAQRLSGSPAGEAAQQSWRELEVELVEHADEGFLDAVEHRLAGSGVARSSSSSKLARALGDPASDGAGRRGTAAPRRRVTASSTAGEVVLAHLDEQVRELVGLHAAVRLDAPDAVHRMRVASRRLRSALTTFAPVLTRARAREVRAELAWWAGVLGGARDAEVLRERLTAAVLDAGGPEASAQYVGAVLDAEHERAHTEVRAAQDGQRYRQLVTTLEALVADPPLTAQAARPAREVLLRRMRRAHRELAGLVEDALSDAAPEPSRGREDDAGGGGSAAHDEALHEARKSAKRARYAAEALAPLWPAAADYTRAVKRLQAELGEHQDSAVARAELTRLADAAGGGQHAFTFGRLHGLEEARARQLEAPLPELWRAVGRRSARRWMKR